MMDPTIRHCSNHNGENILCCGVYEHPCFQADWVALTGPSGVDSMCYGQEAW